MAVGPVVEGKATREVWIEVNGEVRAVSVEDKNSAVETFTREKATSDPGSVGAPMSGVVVEVRVKEGHEVKKGDILCVQSAMKVGQCRSTCVLATDEHISSDGVGRQRTCLWPHQAGLGPRRRVSCRFGVQVHLN